MNKPQTPGSHYRKVDLHIHTPQSYDYKDKTASADDIVNAAISAGLAAIAITDHNDYRFIDQVKAAAVGKDLIIFPGVEISTREGHLLALFDPSYSGEHVRNLLLACDLEDENEFGKPNTNCGKPIEEVASIVQSRHGLAIAAHVDGDKGFLQTSTVGQTRLKIFQNSAIEAVEILDATKKNDWTTGKLYSTPKACIQGSDAHSLAQIGTRTTWISLAKLTLQGLHLAFKEPVIRISFPDEFEYIPRNYIEKLSISQGFFKNQEIQFNPGLNCIVGGQGVGKSAVIEFIRFVLDNRSIVSDIEKDHLGKLHELLGIGGEISVWINTIDGSQYKITRTFNGKDNPYRVDIISGDVKEEYSLSQLSKYFPILAYSQGEGMSIARDVVRQLELIDAHIDTTEIKTKLKQLKRELDSNTGQLKTLDAQLSDLPDLLTNRVEIERDIKRIENQLAQIDAVKQEDAVKTHQLWIDEFNYFRDIALGIEKLKQNLISQIDNVKIDMIEHEIPSTGLGNEDELEVSHNLAEKAKEILQNTRNSIEFELDELVRKTRDSETARAWAIKFNTHRIEYEAASKRIANIEVNKLNNNLSLKKDTLNQLNIKIKKTEAQQEQKRQLIREREEKLSNVEKQLAILSTKRERHAKHMTTMLGGRVQISVRRGENTENYSKWLHENVKGRHVQTRHLQSLVESSITPREFADLLRQNDREDIQRGTNLTPSIVDNLLSFFDHNPHLIYDLECLTNEDLPDIRMRRNDGEYRELNQLSTGQKFTVIILLALTDDDQPIIYDQPEDALDTAMIYSDIAKILRASKHKRQFIFATHNSNISVAADLDLAIVIEGSATMGQITQTGGLEDQLVKDLLITYLEGGTDAMNQRLIKYGLARQNPV